VRERKLKTARNALSSVGRRLVLVKFR